AWDREEVKLSPEEKAAAQTMREQIRRLRCTDLKNHDIGGRSACHVLFVTSFPPISAAPVPRDAVEFASNNWQKLSVEFLQEERRYLQKNSGVNDWRGLLRFGPEKEP